MTGPCGWQAIVCEKRHCESAAIVQETMSHVAATGVTRVEEQLDSLIRELVGGCAYHPVTVIRQKDRGQGTGLNSRNATPH
jgi:hypothetical protein